MIFKQLNKISCKTYLVGSEKNREALVVDPVLNYVPEYMALLKNEGLKLTHIIDTHTHADHISGAGTLAEQTGAVYVMHQLSPVRCVTFRVPDGFECHLGDIPARVMHTPGHTNDSLCLIFSDRILTGDTLFLDDGGAGRTDLPGGDPAQHWESIQKIMKLPGHLLVYPAHEYRGREPSSLAEQKKRNPNLQPRTKDAYTKWLSDMKLTPAEWMGDVLKANCDCSQDLKAAHIPTDAPACEVKGAASPKSDERQTPTISVAEVKRRIAANQLKGAVIIDVREPAELKGDLGIISGVINIPAGQVAQRLGELEEYKDTEVITVCKSGMRAGVAANLLIKAGFKKVFTMTGGMMAFRAAEKK